MFGLLLCVVLYSGVFLGRVGGSVVTGAVTRLPTDARVSKGTVL